MKFLIRILPLMLAILTGFTAYGQITIGAGTNTQRDPFTYYYGYGRDASIYTANEMNTVSAGGTITSLQWYSNLASGWVTGPTRILYKFVAATTDVPLDTWANTLAGATQVYNGTPTWVNGWNSFSVSIAVPAGENLMILVECNVTGSGTGGPGSNAIRYTTSGTNSHGYWIMDNTPPTGDPTINALRPNIRLGGLTAFMPPNCVTLNTPANAATGVVVNTPLTWTAGAGPAATAYKVYLSTTNPPLTLVSTVTAPTTTYTPTGQLFSTTYYWRIVPTNPGGDAVGPCPIYSYTTEAPPPAPANDLCANAIAFPAIPTDGTCATVTATTVSATGSDDPTCTGVEDDDIWYTFTVPVGYTSVLYANLDVSGSDDLVLQVLDACGGTSLGCYDPESGTLTGLVGGNTYVLRAYTWLAAPASSVFNICLAASGSALPLELKSFTGQAQATANVLNWETLTEKNVKSHLVERSIDGQRWSEVGRVAGKTNSQASVKYALEDRAPLAKAYYRLRSVDFDGQENVSSSIVLTRKGENFGITSVYPSPTTDNVTVQFNSTSEEEVTVRVMDMTGRLVMQQIMEAVKNINELPITLTDLQAGVYSVTVSNSASVSTPVRFVKQ